MSDKVTASKKTKKTKWIGTIHLVRTQNFPKN